MRILLLSSRLPHPPDRGDRLLVYRTLEVFAPHHEVHLLSFQDASDAPESVAAIRALGVHVRTVHRSRTRSLLRTGLALFGRDPLQVAYFDSRRMNEAARSAEAGEFDVVAAQMVRMAPYGLLPPARFRVVLLGDSLGLALARRAPFEAAWKRPLVRLEQARVERYERAMAARYDEGWMVSEEDRDHFPLSLHGKLRVVPNGFPPSLLQVPAHRPGANTLLFVGHLAVPHNVDIATQLAREILPLVRAQIPGARLRLVGAAPAPAVRALADSSSIDVVGFVPDLGDEFRRADVFVAPPRFASGVQNKLIEAIAAGVPVVTSPIGSRGLGLGDDGGGMVSIGDGAEAVAQEVVRLLRDPRRGEDQAARARDWASKRFQWENSLRALEDIGSRLAGNDQSPAEGGHARVEPGC